MSFRFFFWTRSEHPYLEAVQTLATLAFERFITLPYHIDLIYYLTPSGWKWRRACKTVHEFSTNVIKERREALRVGGRQQESQKERKVDDFVDILLRARVSYIHV